MTDDPLAAIQAALEAGHPDEARALADRAYRAQPDDSRTRDAYLGLSLAHAIRLAAQAREVRREDIMRRDIPYDTEFEDGPDAAKAFDEAAAALDAVLAVDPKSEKALMMKASLLFRRDRETGRPAALEILRSVAASNPANRQVQYEIRRIETPCPRCGDSGFCARCHGRGSRRRLRIETKCETCHGQGICPVCGIL